MSRRTMLRSFAGVGAGAVLGAVAVAATAGPVSATQGQPVLAGVLNTATGTTRILRGNNASGTDPFMIAANSAIWGESAQTAGVGGTSQSSIGVFGASSTSNGVEGRSTSGDGVRGASNTGTGVEGVSPNGDGVTGGSTTGSGVRGSSASGAGVSGEGATGVEGSSTSGTGIGVAGVNANNVGVRGVGKTGVLGASFTGIGGQFGGLLAPIQLSPTASAGRPTTGTHSRGELVVDNTGSLFICTANGTPGTWRKVTTTAA
jgi:hypothetical protein